MLFRSGRCVELSSTSDVCVMDLNLPTSVFNKDISAPRTRSRFCGFSQKRWVGRTSRPLSRREFCSAPGGTSLIFAFNVRSQTRLESRDPKLDPDLTPLLTLRSVDMVCHLWQQYVNIALMPLSSSSVTTRREMVIFNNQTISRIEGAANALLQRVTDSTWCLFYDIPDRLTDSLKI